MSIAIGDTVSGGTARSILFVGPTGLLAQDSANFKWNLPSAQAASALFVNGAGDKEGTFTAMNTGSTATSTTPSAIKTALAVTSIGAWTGSAAESRAIFATASGGPADANYAGFFKAGDVVLQDGRLGVQVLKPSARLHLAAGSASAGAAALKLNAGAKLAAPETGAIEWDETQIWITQTGGQRRSLIPAVANVLDFGAIGNGTTDDRNAFQAAVDSLVTTGGVVFVPPGKIYGIGSKVSIKSKYSIWIRSSMAGRLTGGGGGTTHADKGLIRPLANLDYMFEWTNPEDTPGVPLKWGQGGGGGVEGLCFTDWDAAGGTSRNKTIDGAIRVHTAEWFCIDCTFEWLKGRAIRFDTTIYSQLRSVKIYNCGAAGKPPIDIDGGTIAPAAKVWQVDESATPTFVDVTAVFNSSTTGDLQIFPASEAVDDYLAIGYEDKFSILTFGNTGGTAGVGGVVLWQYWNGADWVTIDGVTDGTSSFTATGNKQHVVLSVPTNWATRTLNGSATLYYVRAKITTVYTTNPIYDWGFAHGNGFVWWDRGFTESSQYGSEQAVRVNFACLLAGSGLYFEDSSPVVGPIVGHEPYIDSTDGGGLDLSNCWFMGTLTTSVIVGGPASRIKGSRFHNFPGSDPTIHVLAAAYQTTLSDLNILAPGQTGRSILLDATFCQLDGIYLNGGGGIGGSGIHNALSGIYMYAPQAESGQYALDLGLHWTLDGGIVDLAVNTGDGSGGSACHGIRANGANVTGMRVIRRPATKIGIESTQATDVIESNFVDNSFGGKPYVFVNGTTASSNYPWPDGLIYSSAAASGAVSNTTTETYFNKTYTIDTDRLRRGAAIRIRAQAFVTIATGGGTLNLRLKIGTTVIQATGAITAASSFLGYFDATLIVRTTGTSGTVIGTTEWALGANDVVTPKIGFLASTGIDTTASQTVRMSAQWSVADLGNSVRLDILAVEILSPANVG